MSKLTISERASLLKLAMQGLKLYIQVKINKRLIRLFNTTPRRIERQIELHTKVVAMNMRLTSRLDSLGLLEDVDRIIPKN